MIRTLFALALTLALTPSAFAQPQTPSPAAARVQHVDFDDADAVEGRTQRPDEVLEQGHRVTPNRSLIRVRTDFRAQLLQTAETL